MRALRAIFGTGDARLRGEAIGRNVRWCALVGWVVLGASGASHAQRYAHRDVPAGRVTGLELGVEGALEVPAGGRLRWFVTVYEVIAHRDLRPSPSTHLSVVASFRRRDTSAEIVTDAYGRATIELDVPATLEGAFELVVEARAPRREGRGESRAIGITRRFDVNVRVTPRHHIELFVDRTSVPRGASFHAWGRVIERARSAPAVDAPVRVAIIGRPEPTTRGRPGIAHTRVSSDAALAPELRTDARGLFFTTLQAGETLGPVRLVAVTQAAVGPAQATVTVRDAESPELVVYATPRSRVVVPGASIDVDVVVRTPSGRPVEGATLTGLSIPVANEERRIAATRTDASGRARVPWIPAPAARASAYRDVSGTVDAVRTGLGTGSTTVQARVGRAQAVVTFAVEGGALVPTLPGALFVRVQRPDGAPHAAQRVSLRSRTLSADAATTDAHGIAVLETRWARAAVSDDPSGEDDETDGPDGCAGPTVAAATLEIGTHVEALCVPVDPDATVRVRADAGALVEAGATLDVEVLRRSEVARAPLAVMALAWPADGPARPLVERVVGPGESRVSIALPPDALGTVWVRARPLIGGERQEVRGGGALVEVVPRRGLSVALDASPDGVLDVRVGGVTEPSPGFAFALPLDEGRVLLAALAGAHGVVRSQIDTLGPDGLRAELAARVPSDVAAPSVLRDATVLPVTMPAEPVRHGLLRDPWRSRARFVRGRLGRMFRAIQDRVAASSPGSMDEVAVETRRGWRFNRELLSPILEALGPEAVSGLDGSELDLDALVALDPGFSFDRVARRVTRERLLRVLVALDAFVRARGLGYTWARRGDPSSWLTSLADGESESSAPFDPSDLYDGWGRAFAVRRASGERARFRFLEPIVGWEVVSSGPDGRFATADDFWDPFARVTPPGSVYGEAVGEETLLARLGGVELGRATIEALGTLFEVEPGSWASSAASSATMTWGSPIGVLEEATETLRTSSPSPVIGSMQSFAGDHARVRLELDQAPRRYLVVAGAFGRAGELAFGSRPLSAGTPLALDATPPTTLVVGDQLQLPVDVTWLGRGALTLSARATSTQSAARTAAAPLSVVVSNGTIADDATGAGRAHVELAATRPGLATLHLEVRDAAGRTLRSRVAPIRVLADGTLRAQHAAALVERTATLRFDDYADAISAERRLVVLAPLALAHDPGFDRAHPETLALRAWALAARGETIAPRWLRLLSSIEPRGLLDAACAAVVWSASGASQTSLARAIESLRGAASSDPRRDAAALVALAPAAAGLAATAGHGDPVAARIARWRRRAWAALATDRDDPGLLARFAAGLLLADQRDRAGRELYTLARAALVESERGGRVLPADPRRADDGIGSTAALALAARQVGDRALADELGRVLAPRIYLAMRDEPDTTFWLLAASTMGAFGVDRPVHVELTIDGRRQRVALGADGAAAITLGPDARVVTVASRSPVLARIEARYTRAVTTRTESPLRVRLEGHAGDAFETSAFELVVESRHEHPIARPIVEITLPSAALFDEPARASLLSIAGVADVEPVDRAGVLRIVLAPLSPHRELRVPIALRWIAAGRSRGIAVAAYDAARPWRRSTLAPRTWSLRPPRIGETETP